MCYVMPLAGTIVTSTMWYKNKSEKVWWLNLMFCGGTLFGIIDHIWNGELFLISKNIFSDLMLGTVITGSIFVCWLVTLALNKTNPRVRTPAQFTA